MKSSLTPTSNNSTLGVEPPRSGKWRGSCQKGDLPPPQSPRRRGWSGGAWGLGKCLPEAGPGPGLPASQFCAPQPRHKGDPHEVSKSLSCLIAPAWSGSCLPGCEQAGRLAPGGPHRWASQVHERGSTAGPSPQMTVSWLLLFGIRLFAPCKALPLTAAHGGLSPLRPHSAPGWHPGAYPALQLICS